jgi:hypothetical protein
VTNRTDDKGTVVSAVGTEVEYLQSLGATSDQVNDAWLEVFADGGATATQFNDAAVEFLTIWGATAPSTPGMWKEYWAGGGGAASSNVINGANNVVNGANNVVNT